MVGVLLVCGCVVFTCGVLWLGGVLLLFCCCMYMSGKTPPAPLRKFTAAHANVRWVWCGWCAVCTSVVCGIYLWCVGGGWYVVRVLLCMCGV